MRRICLLAWLAALACTDRAVDSATRLTPADSSPAAPPRPMRLGGNESIPAEWTVFEDTSSTGEVITASLQLPAAREIQGLLKGEEPRLILRCVDGKVEASIETEMGDTVEPRSVAIQLDSPPPCE